jgi:hypothetical protein
MTFYLVKLLRKLLTLDGKGNANDLKSYLVPQYRNSKETNLKRKQKAVKFCQKHSKEHF